MYTFKLKLSCSFGFLARYNWGWTKKWMRWIVFDRLCLLLRDALYNPVGFSAEKVKKKKKTVPSQEYNRNKCINFSSNCTFDPLQEFFRTKICLCSSQTPTCWTCEWHLVRWLTCGEESHPLVCVCQVDRFSPSPRQRHHPGAALGGGQHALAGQWQRLFPQRLRRLLQRHARWARTWKKKRIFNSSSYSMYTRAFL